MNKKLVLTVSGIGFLLVNGITIPFLTNNFNFSKFFVTNPFGGGGGVPPLINFPFNNKGVSSIQLSVKSPQSFKSDISKSSEAKLNLEALSEGISLNSLFRENAGNSNILSSIKEIYSSVETESKVQKVEEQTQSQYLELLRQKIGESSEEIQEHLKNFNEVKNQLPSSQRGRRSPAGSQNFYLSKEHRAALGKFYILHHSLKQTSVNLSHKLQSELNGQVDLSPFANSITTPNVSDIEKSLRDIGWEETFLKAYKNKSVEDYFDSQYWGPQRGRWNQRKLRSVKFFNHKSWGRWSNNSFRPFYSSESEFEQDILAYKKKAMSALEAMQNEARTNRRNSFWRFALVQDPTIKQKLTSMDFHITQKIALFLFDSMNV